MDELTRAPERVLIDCFRALDAGATSDDCLTRYPMQADSLRGVLDMRAQLLTLKTTAPSPTTFASGREALLARVVRPLASSHPGSMEPEGRPARGRIWRPATRAAFAGALLFAMASCAIGVSATPAVDKIDQALPNIPTIDVPHQRPPYPFPEYNGASPDVLPTTEPVAPSNNEPVEVAPQPSEQPQSDPAAEPADAKPEPTKPSNPGDTWLPPTNAHETDPPDIETPDPTVQPDDAESSDKGDEQGSTEDSSASHDGNPSDQDASSSDGDDSSDQDVSSDDRPHSDGDTDDIARRGEISADGAASS